MNSARSQIKTQLKEATNVAAPEPTALGEAAKPDIRCKVEGLNFWYDNFQALKDISLDIIDNRITAIIGASGCGKSTLLRCFNRMHDLYSGTRYEGKATLYPENMDIVGKDTDPMLVRLHVGMVFQKPNPFPKSIYENIAAGLRIRGIRKKSVIDEHVEKALRQAAIWDELKDRLDESAFALSGGQQQRLCIARALAPQPELLLLDEPTSALDPIATAKIEDLITELGKSMTILIVTHNMQQAARVSDYTVYMHLGELIEFGKTSQVFTNPKQRKTSDYITGRFG